MATKKARQTGAKKLVYVIGQNAERALKDCLDYSGAYFKTDKAARKAIAEDEKWAKEFGYKYKSHFVYELTASVKEVK